MMLTQDGDLEYDPSDWRALVEALPPAPLAAVIGNRWAQASLPTTWRRLHAGANRLLTSCSNMLTGLRLADMECGFKLLRVPLLRRVLPWLSEDRFGVEPQLVAALARVRAEVREVPVSYDPRDRSRGKKIGPIDGLRAIWVIVAERARRAPPVQR